MTSSALRAHLEPIARLHRQHFFWRGLAHGWGWSAIAIGLVILGCRMLSWWPPYIVPLMILAPAVVTLAVWIRSRNAQPDYREVAHELERENPRLRTVLLAALAQEPDPKTGEFGFLQLRVIAEALAQNERNPWMQKRLESLFLVQSSSWLALVFLLGAVVGLVSLAPPGRTLAFTSLAEVSVTPGNTMVERGSSVVVLSKFSHRIPAEATLVVNSSSGTRRIRLDKNLDDPVFGGTIPDIKEEVRYSIEYDNRTTPEFHVQVFDYPRLERADATLKFPDYTGQPAKTIENTRRISAVEGSVLDYALHMNKPLISAKLVDRNKAEVPLEPDPSRPNVFLARFDLEESRQFELWLRDEAGRTNKIPSDFVIDVVPNRPAELKITFPRQDQRVSALEELTLQAEASDDFGLKAYGIAYTIAGQETQFVELGQGGVSHEKRPLAYLLPLEDFQTQPDQLVTYYVWADDLVRNGEVRRTASDMYFAEIRPFEEIFREGQQDAGGEQNQQGGGMQQRPSTQLTELQKQIIHATWKLKRQEGGKKKVSESYAKDIAVVHESQQEALRQAEKLKEETENPRMAPLVENVIKEMKKAIEHLAEAEGETSIAPLDPAISAEQSAYQRLLHLQAREFQVSRGRGGGGGGGGSMAQRQLDQLELKQSENRYETQRQAQRQNLQQSPEQREQLQVLSRLRELAQRQQDINQRLKELQTALTEAKTEEQKEEIRRQLKRLREEQQDMLADVDELRQRMNRPMNQSDMAEARRQLEETRSEMNRAAEELENGAVSQALASGTRAQRELQQMRDDFRKKSSSQFSDEMRDLRTNARELAEKQENLAQAIEDLALNQRKTLSDTTQRNELADSLNRQTVGLTNLLETMRQLTERSEQAEPLLSRQLYDMLRRTDVNKANTNLNLAGELLRRGFVTQAGETEPQARAVIDELKSGVERAAESVLGDEMEALRAARSELEELRREVEEELARSAGTNSHAGQTASNSNAGGDPNAKGEQQGEQGERGERQQLAAGRGEQNSQNDQQSAQPSQRDGQAASNQAGEQPGSQSAGQTAQTAQNGQGQTGGDSPGQQGGTRGGGARGSDQEQRAERGEPNARNPGQERPGGRRSLTGGGGGGGDDRGGWLDGNLADRTGGAERTGPLTGGSYVNWADRLRDVEEMVDSPELRTELSRIRDRARGFRTDFKRHSKPPQWELVQAEIISPLTEVYRRVSEELARRESQEAIVPIDRDPVPRKFSELVRRYYERLGNSQ